MKLLVPKVTGIAAAGLWFCGLATVAGTQNEAPRTERIRPKIEMAAPVGAPASKAPLLETNLTNQPRPVLRGCSDSPDFGPYMVALSRRVRSNWHVQFRPDDLRRTVVVFKIRKDGTVSNLRLDKSSGSQSLDAQAMEAVRKSEPFGHFPDGSPDDIVIQFTFDRNLNDKPKAKESRPAAADSVSAKGSGTLPDK